MVLKLKSTQRINRRYLLIEAESKEIVEKTILDYIGILGYSKAGVNFVNEFENKIILSVTRESLNEVRASFELSKEKIKVILVSGTIKGLNL